MELVSRGAVRFIQEDNLAHNSGGEARPREKQQGNKANCRGLFVQRQWVPVKERSNDQWLAALRGPKKDEALADLRIVLVRGLRAALRGQSSGVELSVEDFVQEALIRILDNLDSFRGESRFTTWAHKICVRTAFAELRRRRWRDVSLEEAIHGREESVNTPADPLADPERAATQRTVMTEFRRFIDEELTDRQRRALLAALGGMHLEEVARRMGTNRNALYKLLHDARKRLKRRMTAEGLSPQDVLGAFS
jgi:RNA polymerase sigma-70 factor (ECF subfamily)